VLHLVLLPKVLLLLAGGLRLRAPSLPRGLLLQGRRWGRRGPGRSGARLRLLVLRPGLAPSPPVLLPLARPRLLLAGRRPLLPTQLRGRWLRRRSNQRGSAPGGSCLERVVPMPQARLLRLEGPRLRTPAPPRRLLLPGRRGGRRSPGRSASPPRLLRRRLGLAPSLPQPLPLAGLPPPLAGLLLRTQHGGAPGGSCLARVVAAPKAPLLRLWGPRRRARGLPKRLPPLGRRGGRCGRGRIVAPLRPHLLRLGLVPRLLLPRPLAGPPLLLAGLLLLFAQLP